MAMLDDRVVVITGAGRGMGREHALACSAEGAKVVVNDLGCDRDGSGSDPTLAEAVVAEIIASGGQAIANTDDVATFDGATQLIDDAVAAYGRVDVLVNNAGILRDRMFINMTEEDWDVVIRGHLRTVFCPTRIAAALWRDRSKAGEDVRASVISMSSTSGLIGQVGQTNYGAAKAGIAAMTVILAEELSRYGVRVNAITPVARTRMTEEAPGVAELVKKPDDPSAFDTYAPGNVSPLVAWLATTGCSETGQVFYARGGVVRRYIGWHHEPLVETDRRWEVAELGEAISYT